MKNIYYWRGHVFQCVIIKEYEVKVKEKNMLFDWLIRVYIDSVVANILFPILPQPILPRHIRRKAEVHPPEAAFKTFFVIILPYTCSVFIHCLCKARHRFITHLVRTIVILFIRFFYRNSVCKNQCAIKIARTRWYTDS